MLETIKKLAELQAKRREAGTTYEFIVVSHAFDSVARNTDFAAIAVAWEQILAERLLLARAAWCKEQFFSPSQAMAVVTLAEQIVKESE